MSEAPSLLTYGALHRRMYAYATWDIITQEISAGRLLILFTSGHARVVTGFSIYAFNTGTLHGLFLYDPLGAGVYWEVFKQNSQLLLSRAKLHHWTLPGGGMKRICYAA